MATVTQRAAAAWSGPAPSRLEQAALDPLPREPRFRPTTTLGPREELRALPAAAPAAPPAVQPAVLPASTRVADLSSSELLELIDGAEPRVAVDAPLVSLRVYDVFVTR